MTRRSSLLLAFALLAPLAVASGCFYELSLHGKDCDDAGRCADGYVCGPSHTCILPGEMPSPLEDGGPTGDDDGGPSLDGGDDAGVDGGPTPDGGTDGGTDGGLGDAGVTDGGLTDGGVPAEPWEVIACANPPTAAPGSDVCELSGSGARLRLVGDVLTPGRVYEQGSVVIDEDGVIECVGCDCGASESGTTQLVCPDAVISPGLINAHQHLASAAEGPPQPLDPDLPVSDERYEHRHDWRSGEREHTQLTVSSSATLAQRQWTELRLALGGATSVHGGTSTSGLLRNLDFTDALGPGLTQPAVASAVFPLGDLAGQQLEEGCAYPGIVDAPNADAWAVHVAEGIDAVAHNELRCLTSTEGGGKDVIGANTAVIGGVALLPQDAALLATRGAKLVWSPRSDLRLYGNTAPVTMLDAAGVPIALGTDWLATGSMDLLRELQCADTFNRDHLGGWFSDEALWRMATLRAARAMEMDDAIGVLASGRLGDVAVFKNNGRRHYRAVLEASADDVALVLLAGQPLVGEPALVDALEGGCDLVPLCEGDKRVCVGRETGMSLFDLTAAAGVVYPLSFCGVPEREPECVPRRVHEADTVDLDSSVYPLSAGVADDVDGDGVVDDVDNCPTVFNPIRPIDLGAQGDADDDGVGDACDVCPLHVADDCAPPSPDDRDHDGRPDLEDNCAATPNPEQVDSDGDGKGDACDPCPALANPGQTPCTVTVYDVKSGTFVGERVNVPGLVVTAVASNGFFAQLPPGASGYAGASGSGVFVFPSIASLPARGDRVTITNALVETWFGQIQLTDPTWTVDASGVVVPATALTQTEIEQMVAEGSATGFEGVLVQVENVTVTDVSPEPGPGDTGDGELELAGGLRVDDLLYALQPSPNVGHVYSRLTGPVVWRNERLKLLPRDANDVQD